MENAEQIDVEVAYALPENQTILKLRVPAGTTIEQAVRESAILERYPEIDLAINQVGIFGKLNKLDAPLRNGDRGGNLPSLDRRSQGSAQAARRGRQAHEEGWRGR